MRPTTLIVAACTLVAGSSLQAQRRPYYLTGSSGVRLIQNGHLINQWAERHDAESIIAVDDDVRTLGQYLNSAYNERDRYSGSQYRLDGTYMGEYKRPEPPLWMATDGASDGTHHYIVDELTRNLIRTDKNWEHPSILFQVPIFDRLLWPESISFDRSAGEFWISYWHDLDDAGPSFLASFSLTGDLRNGFFVPAQQAAALAFDDSDGTIWFNERTGTTQGFYQFDREGNKLDYFTIPELAGISSIGGEFGPASRIDDNPVPGVTPEPATLFLTALGLISLGGFGAARRTKEKALNA